MKSTDSGIHYELTAKLPASPQRVFEALTDATILKKIWGVQEITVDARVGGKAEATFVAGGQDWSFTLTYAELAPHHTLRWVTHFKSSPTKETRVTVRLKEANPGTELNLRMENFESAEERDANRQAWQGGLSALSDILRKP